MNASLLRIAAILGLLGGWLPQAAVAQKGDDVKARKDSPPSSGLFPEGATDDQVGGRSGELVWKNGDALRGRLSGDDGTKDAGPNHLVWKSDLFAQPLMLDPERLRSLAFDINREQKNSSDAGDRPLFRVITRERNSIDGELAAIDAEQIFLRRSGTENTIAIARDRVVEIVGLDSPDLLLHGFNRNRTWSRRSEKTQNDSGWNLAANGRFESKRWRSLAQFELNAEDSFIADIKLITIGQRPDFSLGFDSSSKGLRLETWQDELVLNFGDVFAPVMTLNNKDRELHLQIGIDSRAKTASVYDVTGKRLTVLDFSQAGKSWKVSEALIQLKNKGANLAIDRLVVRHWDPDAKGMQSLSISEGIQLGDGTVMEGNLNSLRLEDGESLSVGKGILRKRVPLAEVASITLAGSLRDGTNPVLDSSDSVSFSNGQYLSGKLLAINAESFRMKVEFSDSPIDMSLEGVHGLSFRNSGARVIGSSTEDNLFSEGQRLTGAIVDGSGVGKVIAWKCDGADNAVAIRDGSNSRVVRGVLPGGTGKGWHQAHDNLDRLVLRSEEIVSCRIGEIDEQSVHFSHSVAAGNSIPLDKVKAVEFADQTERQQGFDDLRWRVLSEDPASVSHTGNRMAFMASKNGKIGHASALAAREVKFDLGFGKKGQGGAVRMHLFGSSADDSEDGLELTILASGSRVWATRVEQGRPFMFSNNGLQGVSKYPLPVLLKMIDTRVEVYIDDQLALSEEVDSKMATGHALQFSVDPMSVRYGGPSSVISISDLEVIREKGSHEDLKVSARAQREALTVPRFRRGNPQRHVLIAGNGDLLRGHLVAVGQSEINFRSQLEKVVLPRHRIAGVVWLDEMQGDDAAEVSTKAKEKSESLAREGEVEVILNDGSRIKLLAQRLSDEFLSGDSQLLGECKIPMADVRELRSAGFTAPGISANEEMFYTDWQLVAAQEPAIPAEADGDIANGGAHQTVGSDAKSVKLPLLIGGEFALSEARGKIVVLDFWATWCAPCMQTMPLVEEAIAEFDPQQVRLVSVNLEESANHVRSVLERHEMKVAVALDIDGVAAQRYQAKAIPQMVIVGKDGKIARLYVGGGSGMVEQMKTAISQLLEPAS